ncbi:MAG: hypothetical protein ACRDRG_11990 [Pseudonocardiaceae bacterium]
MSDTAQSPGARSVRLIFEYEGEQFRLMHQQPLDVAITDFDLLPEQLPGHYVEVRGANEQLFSRVPIRSRMTTSTEVFPENPTDAITRIDVPQAQGAFTVVVPAPSSADHVTVVRIDAGPSELNRRASELDQGAAAVVELGSFALDGADQQ